MVSRLFNPFTMDEPRRLGLTLVMPSLIIVFGFLLFPFLYSLVLSLMNYDLARPRENGFIGLRNYFQLARDKYFLNSIVVTLLFSFASVVLEIILGVAIALVMNQDFKGRGILRALVIIPWAQIVMICALLQVIWSLLHTFELVYVVTRGGPFNSTDIVPMRIYWQTFKALRFGYGAAMAYLAALALLIPATFYIRSAYMTTVE